MINPKRTSISAALIILVCFFMPWLQVSCGRSEETISGIDLARDHGELWLVPLLMVAVLLLNYLRGLRDRRAIIALADLIAGLLSAYLINRERLRAEDTSALLVVRVTVWLLLALASAIILALLGAFQLLSRPKPT